MFVIRLPNGNLLVPESVLADGGQLIGDGYVEIGPSDADYPRLAEQAVTEEDMAARRRRWEEGDAALQQQFAEFLASRGGSGGEAGSRPG